MAHAEGRLCVTVLPAAFDPWPPEGERCIEHTVIAASGSSRWRKLFTDQRDLALTYYPAMLQPDHAADEAWIAPHNASLLKAYMERSGPKKLQLGSGGHLLEGWLNSDRRRVYDDTFILDVAKPFDLQDAMFDNVYCEHMIEHLDLEQGLAMLSECLRVLKPDGIIRVATPSLGFLVRLMCSDRSDLEDKYLKWASENFQADGFSDVAVVVNGFVRSWGHRFIYDHLTLKQAFQRAGFQDVEECSVRQSRHESLRDLEFVSRLPPGFLELESMIYEGRRP